MEGTSHKLINLCREEKIQNKVKISDEGVKVVLQLWKIISIGKSEWTKRKNW